jgi:hypothetical protein
MVHLENKQTDFLVGGINACSSSTEAIAYMITFGFSAAVRCVASSLLPCFFV